MNRLPVKMMELLELAARHPEGHAPLYEGHLESVAALYQVHPSMVERFRACLAQEGGRRRAGQTLQRLHLHPAPAPLASASALPSGCAAVIARAMRSPDLIELLASGPVEAAAVLLQTHPFVIDEIRKRLPNGVATSAAEVGK